VAQNALLRSKPGKELTKQGLGAVILHPHAAPLGSLAAPVDALKSSSVEGFGNNLFVSANS
jgi:hypothetical protein